LNGEQQDFNNGEYGPDLINDFAIDFVTRHKAEPFLLYYPMLLTHGPYLATPDSSDWDPKAHGEQMGQHPKHFAEMTAFMDKLVGRLMGTLDELGIRDNTLVIFLGDNGTGAGTISQFNGAPYKGGKGRTTARGMHVPLIVNWPARITRGSVNSDLVSSTDFLPTLCQVAGAKIPAETKQDGQSFLPQILGEKGTPRETFYTWYGSGQALEKVREFAMTTEHKLYRDGRFYDLTADPFEESPRQRENLTGKEAAAAEKLAAVLAQYANARPAEMDAAAKVAAQSNDRPNRADRPRRRQARRRQAAAAAAATSPEAVERTGDSR
jgi:arylsulfatase A